MKTIAAAAALFIGAALSATPAMAADDTTKPLSAGTLSKHPSDYVGKTVTVRAEVEDVLGSNMFTLDEDALIGGADVLVLVPGGMAGTLAHDEKVTVTGEVRPYVEADLDRDFDFFDNGKIVEVNKKVDWKTRPVIVARSIRTDAGRSVIVSDNAAAPMVRRTSMGRDADAISAGKLAKDYKGLVGRTVTVRSEVEDVVSGNMFTLDEDALFAGPDVLVMVPGGVTGTLAHDQKVTVTGEVRTYVEADLDRDFDFFDNGKLVQVHKEVDWKTRPVLVARSIRTADGTELIGRR
jgi:hypothetical protein